MQTKCDLTEIENCDLTKTEVTLLAMEVWKFNMQMHINGQVEPHPSDQDEPLRKCQWVYIACDAIKWALPILIEGSPTPSQEVCRQEVYFASLRWDTSGSRSHAGAGLGMTSGNSPGL